MLNFITEKLLNKQKPQPFDWGSIFYLFTFQSVIRTWRCPTLTWGCPTLPSALQRFTSEFGMESGGSTALLPPG